MRTGNGPGLFIKPISQYVPAGTNEHNEKLQLVVSVSWIFTGHFPQVSITSWANLLIFILFFCGMFVGFTSSLKSLKFNAAESFSNSCFLQNNSRESCCVGHVMCQGSLQINSKSMLHFWLEMTMTEYGLSHFTFCSHSQYNTIWIFLTIRVTKISNKETSRQH